METRNILDANENIIGELSLPDGTSEQEWAARLAEFQYVTPTPSLSERVKLSIQNAITFGLQLMIEFASENVLLGITQAGMTSTVRLRLAGVVNALQTGSLYDAIHELKIIPEESKDGTFITDARLLSAVNRIEKYLVIALSENLEV